MSPASMHRTGLAGGDLVLHASICTRLHNLHSDLAKKNNVSPVLRMTSIQHASYLIFLGVTCINSQPPGGVAGRTSQISQGKRNGNRCQPAQQTGLSRLAHHTTNVMGPLKKWKRETPEASAVQFVPMRSHPVLSPHYRIGLSNSATYDLCFTPGRESRHGFIVR